MVAVYWRARRREFDHAPDPGGRRPVKRLVDELAGGPNPPLNEQVRQAGGRCACRAIVWAILPARGKVWTEVSVAGLGRRPDCVDVPHGRISVVDE